MRIVLLGPPAAGKSTIAAGISNLSSGSAVFSPDPAVVELTARGGRNLTVNDQTVEEAIDLTIRQYRESTAEFAVLELPHHDYPQFVVQRHAQLAEADLLCIIKASYETVRYRNNNRTNPVPEAYVARSVASSCDLPRVLDRHGLAWAQLDTDTLGPDVAAQMVIDLARRSRSTNLEMLDLLLDPLRPSIGGHLRQGGEWSDSAAAALVAAQRPASVLDVGAGTGFGVARFMDLGLDAWGIEPSPRALTNPEVSHRIFDVDFNQRWLDLPRSFDLVWCVEVLEHLDDLAVDNAIRTIAAAATSTVLISAAQPGQPGYHHVNCRRGDEWIRLLERTGLIHRPDLTSSVRKAAERDCNAFGRSDIAANALVFTRGHQ